MDVKEFGSLVALTIAIFGSAPAAEAQQGRKIPRLCFVSPNPIAFQAAEYDAFLRSLRHSGYENGRSIAIDYLSADGRVDRFPALAAECLRLKADVIVARTTPAAVAAKKATGTVPIVTLLTGDPVGTGLVKSLARPGGNVTGLSHLATGLSAKRLQLLKEAVPGISRVVVLANFVDPVAAPQVKELEDAARLLGVRLLIQDIRTPDALPGAFSAAAEDGAQGLLTTVEAIFSQNRKRVIELAAKHRLATMHPWIDFVEVGGLMYYGVSRFELYRDAATLAGKILSGAKPADLPIEQPTKFEFIVNLKAARSLGITIPHSVLLRADRVIE